MENTLPSLTYLVATSIDGFISDPEGDFSAFPAEGEHMAHLISTYPETLPVHARAALGIDAAGDTFDTVVMGWNTFAVGLREGIDSPYPHLRQIVFSRGDRSREVGAGVEVVSQHPVGVVDALRSSESDRDIWLCGGGDLAGQLVEVIDRLVVKVNPITLGSGIPMFGSAQPVPRSFELSAQPLSFDSGVVLLDYRRVH